MLSDIGNLVVLLVFVLLVFVVWGVGVVVAAWSIGVLTTADKFERCRSLRCGRYNRLSVCYRRVVLWHR